MSDALQVAADEIKARLMELVGAIKSEPKMVEALKLHEAVNTLERLSGAEPTSLSEIFGLDAAITRPKFKVGEFFEMNQLDAAKRYLKKVGEARPLAEIIAAIKEYGGKVTSEADLRLSLSRSTWEVAKVGEDVYGLVEFFPHVKRGKKKKTSDGKESLVENGVVASDGAEREDEEAPPPEEPVQQEAPHD